MRKTLKIFAVAMAALAVYSLIPVIWLYLGKAPAVYTNKEAIARLTDNTGDHFAFIVLGDNHAGLLFNDSATLKLIRNINREDRFKKIPIDFVVVLGDVTFRGSGWDYGVYNRLRSSIKMPVISTIGNHDDHNDGIQIFKKYIGEPEFAFADRNSYFIIFNNIKGDVTEEQFSWLEGELEGSSAYKHRFIIAHKSPISLYQQSWYRPELSSWSYRFMKLCEKYKVDIVLSGHEHMFKSETYGGVRYITSGGGGIPTSFPEQDGGYLHYIVVRVYGDYIDYETRRIFPPFWEFLTYYLWKELFYFLKGLIL